MTIKKERTGVAGWLVRRVLRFLDDGVPSEIMKD
jgi:hypothetical protein